MAATPSSPGLRHVTVVPTNFEEVSDAAADEESN